jgi:hypothetical protein
LIENLKKCDDTSLFLKETALGSWTKEIWYFAHVCSRICNCAFVLFGAPESNSEPTD